MQKILNIVEGNSINTNHRKESKFSSEYLLAYADKDGIKNAISCRFYWTDSRCYCCVWIHAGGIYTAGSAYAGGYGHCKASHAAYFAFKNAGVEFKERFAGHGTQAIDSAMLAIGKKLKLKKCVVLRANG